MFAGFVLVQKNLVKLCLFKRYFLFNLNTILNTLILTTWRKTLLEYLFHSSVFAFRLGFLCGLQNLYYSTTRLVSRGFRSLNSRETLTSTSDVLLFLLTTCWIETNFLGFSLMVTSSDRKLFVNLWVAKTNWQLLSRHKNLIYPLSWHLKVIDIIRSEKWSFGYPSSAFLLVNLEIWSFQINRHVSWNSTSGSLRK